MPRATTRKEVSKGFRRADYLGGRTTTYLNPFHWARGIGRGGHGNVQIAQTGVMGSQRRQEDSSRLAAALETRRLRGDGTKNPLFRAQDDSCIPMSFSCSQGQICSSERACRPKDNLFFGSRHEAGGVAKAQPITAATEHRRVVGLLASSRFWFALRHRCWIRRGSLLQSWAPCASPIS